MRFVRKLPPTDKELSTYLQKDGWKKIKEPSNIAFAIIISLPLAYMLGSIAIWIAYLLELTIFAPMVDIIQGNRELAFSININLKFLPYMLATLLFMVVHEFIHALFIPGVLQSDKTCWGINGVFAFVSTAEPIKKGRFIVISIMPFLLMSVVFPFILRGFSTLNGFMVFLLIINAMGSCVDFLNVILILFQVPNGFIIINNGYETYYSQTKSV
jgi:hypothetical protein